MLQSTHLSTHENVLFCKPTFVTGNQDICTGINKKLDKKA